MAAKKKVEETKTGVDFAALDDAELKELAEFFVIDIVAADDENPSHQELVLSIESAEDPVSLEDYETFKTAQANNDVKSKEVIEEEELAAEEAKKVKAEDAEPVDKSDWVLVRFIGNNPTLEVVGFRFSKRAPFALVPPEIAEYLVVKQEGFRLALPSELQDYYN